ncbi:MAG TPA: mycofactocin system FadH/OYE family oxidoreductase 1 [Ilumatobacteraceae bacterium]
MRLLDPLPLGPRPAANRVMFGPHVTNLGDDDRALPRRWVAYFAARAAGGCATVVSEGASVHDSDWPYERSPLAARCATGWAQLSDACHAHGALHIASLDHAGGQGSSAYNQRELWAPSRVPEVNSREVPKWMEPEDIDAVVRGFSSSARIAADAGCDGVEINAGQHSLVRQFLSGLTNHRGDAYGEDRLRFAREAIAAARAGAGPDRVVGMRLSCDELAPWAGITPEMAPAIAVELARCGLDYIVVVRGSIFSIEKTRPDFHQPEGFNIELCRSVRDALSAAGATTKVVLQGSVTDLQMAEASLAAEVCDLVEMTRAQIADAQLLRAARDGTRPRPCIRCNQTCQVRDARNPIVTCVGEPTSGRETEDPDWYAPASEARDIVVVGGGVAGLEAARVAVRRGHRVRIAERSDTLGGVAAVAGPGAALVEWLIAECAAVPVQYGPDAVAAPDEIVIQATGSMPGVRPYAVDAGAVVLDVLDVLTGTAVLPADGAVAIFDPIGGPIAIALAEQLGSRAVLITQDNIAGNELSRTGDLAPANVRLAQAGVRVERRTLLRVAGADHVTVEDRYTAARRSIPCVAVVDCGFRLPDPPRADAALRVGDCVAPRTILEAVLEGRRAALAVDRVVPQRSFTAK